MKRKEKRGDESGMRDWRSEVWASDRQARGEQYLLVALQGARDELLQA